MRLGICITLLVVLLLNYCHGRPNRQHHRHRQAERGPGGTVERGPGGRNDNKPKTSDKMTTKEAENYFEQYHYMGKKCPDKAIGELSRTNRTMALQQATRMFQRRYSRYGLRETGELDDKTLELMLKPRCGVADLVSMADMMKRKKRYLLTNFKWNKNQLTYRINQYPYNDLSPSEVDQEIDRAFKVWESVTPLRFRKLPYGNREIVDIDIVFVTRDHRPLDTFPFDGPGGALAHAFFPFGEPIAGDAHFDDEETWTIGADRGYNLFQVATHEFGHALGLGHSQDPTALMAPFYPGYQPNFVLPHDDVMGIQRIYGGPVGPREPSTTPRPGTPVDDTVCKNARFDAVTTIYENDDYKTYGFQGKYYFLFDSRPTIAHSYPRLISDSDLFGGVPDNIDAALSWPEVWKRDYVGGDLYKEPAETYIFKGNQYWKVSDGSVEGPLSIQTGWGEDMPGDIDAAFVWGNNGLTYFIKGDQYWRYTRGYGLEPGFPRPLYEWGNLPTRVDAAMQYNNGQTFFFSGTEFWAYDDHNRRVATGYPADSRGLWFRC